MIPVLRPTQSSATSMPESAHGLDSAALFQLGRLALGYENRSWAREKVRQARMNVGMLTDTTEEELKYMEAQLKDREQVLVSFERFYKKLRYEVNDQFPEAISAMEDMIPGSTKGLPNALSGPHP